MSKRIVPPETRFKRNVLELMNLLSEYLSTQRVDMTHFNVAYTYADNEDDPDLLWPFLASSHKHWNELKNKNNKYFIGNFQILVPDRYVKKMDKYVELLTDDEGNIALPRKDQERMWQFVHNMVKTCLIWLHHNKKELTNSQKADPAAVLDTLKLAKEWEVDLNKIVEEDISEDDSAEDGSDSDQSD